MKHTECEDCKLRDDDCGYHFKMDGKTNYDIASLNACDQYGNCMFFKPKAKLQGDLISREELKKNKFLIPDIQFIGGRSNGKTIERITLAYNKGWNAAIDAIYENAPAVEAYTKDDMTNEYLKGYNACKDTIQPTGEWIDEGRYAEGHSEHAYICKKCGYQIIKNPSMIFENRYCKCCGAKTKSEAENDQ